MLRNYIMAALRNLARNRLYTGINIVGLGVGSVFGLMAISQGAIIEPPAFIESTAGPGFASVQGG